MTVIFNLVDSQISEDENGYRIDETVIIEGVTGTAAERLHNALNDLSMPSIGDAHSVVTDITLRSISGQVIDPETVKATLSYYSDPGSEIGSANASVRVNASTSVEEVKVDILGNVMQTEYTVTNSPYSWSVIQPTFTADVETPRITYEFEYIASSFPITEINAYLGKINSVSWNGYAAHSVLCTSVNVSQQGLEYRVTFSFSINVDLWEFRAKIPDAPLNIASSTDPNLSLATGIKVFDIYEEVDFTSLGFTL